MSIKDNRLLKVVAAGAAAVMILGLAAAVTSAQRAPRNADQMQGPGGPGGMGHGMMGGPGMRGGRGGPGGPGGPMGMLGPGMRALGLTDAQRDQIEGVLDSHKAKLDELRAKRGQAQRELHDAITSEQPNPQLVQEKASALGAIGVEDALLQATIHAEVYQLLTAEQQQKLKEMKAEAEKRMQDRSQRMQQRREEIRRYQDSMPVGDPGLV